MPRSGPDDATMVRRAGAATNAALRAGAIAYCRQRDLVRLIRLDPFAPVPEDEAGIAAILARLERAIRAERSRGRAGRWTYDLNRHIALEQAHRAETEALRALRAGRRRAAPGGVASPLSGCVFGRGPSSSPEPNARPYSSAQPSDIPAAVPNARDIARASDHNASADAASRT